jgi:hypothetical protein
MVVRGGAPRDKFVLMFSQPRGERRRTCRARKKMRVLQHGLQIVQWRPGDAMGVEYLRPMVERLHGDGSADLLAQWAADSQPRGGVGAETLDHDVRVVCEGQEAFAACSFPIR